MKTKFLHIDEVHTIQSHKDVVYFGCTVYNEEENKFTDVTLIIPTQIYLQDVAGDFKKTAKTTYKKYIDTL